MMKATGNRLQVIVMIFLFLLLPTACCLPPVYATDSTPSADIKAKLVEFQKDAASQGAKLLELIKKKLQNKAYIGTIKSKSDTTLTLSVESGPKIVNINQDTILPKKMKSEDYVAALGDTDETGVLTARKVILLPAANSEKRKAYLWGQIISVSDLLITLKNNESKNIAATVPNQSKVNLNDFIILTGNKNKSGVFETDFVYVIPQKGVIRPKKTATPSAKIN